MDSTNNVRRDGDIHPNGKLIWVAAANGGKGNWRKLDKEEFIERKLSELPFLRFTIDDFTLKNPKRDIALNGVFHDPSGYAVATDRNVLIYDKEFYDQYFSGKIIAKHKIVREDGVDIEVGQRIFGTYPAWRPIVNSVQNGAVIKRINLLDLMFFLVRTYESLYNRCGRNIRSFNSLIEKTSIELELPDGRKVPMSLEIFRKLVSAAYVMQLSDFYFSTSSYMVMFQNEFRGVLAVHQVHTHEIVCEYSLKNN